MSKQQQTQQAHSQGHNAAGKELVPFIIRAIKGMPDGSTFEDFEGSDSDAPDSPKLERMPFNWDTSHLVSRSYFIEKIGDMVVPEWSTAELEVWLKAGSSKIVQPSRSEEKQQTDDKEGDGDGGEEEFVQDYFPLYSPRQLPELSDVQVDALNTNLLSSITVFDEMRSILKAKLNVNELQQWEYDDFKRNAMAISELAKQAHKLTTVQKKWCQRHLVTNNLLWMLAIDYRYRFDRAQEYIDLVDVDQLSLIWTAQRHITHFALYPKSRVLISKIFKCAAEFKDAVAKVADARKADDTKEEKK